jgi:hypothetical protein
MAGRRHELLSGGFLRRRFVLRFIAAQTSSSFAMCCPGHSERHQLQRSRAPVPDPDLVVAALTQEAWPRRCAALVVWPLGRCPPPHLSIPAASARSPDPDAQRGPAGGCERSAPQSSDADALTPVDGCERKKGCSAAQVSGDCFLPERAAPARLGSAAAWALGQGFLPRLAPDPTCHPHNSLSLSLMSGPRTGRGRGLGRKPQLRNQMVFCFSHRCFSTAIFFQKSQFTVVFSKATAQQKHDQIIEKRYCLKIRPGPTCFGPYRIVQGTAHWTCILDQNCTTTGIEPGRERLRTQRAPFVRSSPCTRRSSNFSQLL